MNTVIRYSGALLLTLLLSFGAAACGDSDDSGDPATDVTLPAGSSQPGTAATSSAASIEIIEPSDGWSADGDRIEVRVAVEGLTLDGTRIGLPASENAGVGHWHVYVDGAYAGLSVSDVIALPNDALPAISAGEHELRVQLHNTDHTPVLPEAADSITVDVPVALAHEAVAGEPAIEIVSPADQSAAGDRVVVRVAVTGLSLDGTKVGEPADATPGIGHWHIYVDGDYAGLSVSDVIALPNDAMPSIAAGAHVVSVQLHHTDHTPVLAAATDAVTLVFP